MKTATATKVSVVYDAGVEIGRRVQTPKRRYTHALMRRAENFTRVQRRHEFFAHLVQMYGLSGENNVLIGAGE